MRACAWMNAYACAWMHTCVCVVACMHAWMYEHLAACACVRACVCVCLHFAIPPSIEAGLAGFATPSPSNIEKLPSPMIRNMVVDKGIVKNSTILTSGHDI